MTRQQAIDTGAAAALRFGKPFIVYRFEKWPPDVYGCIAVDRGLPEEAQTFERLEPDGLSVTVRTTDADDAQRSLF